MIVLFDQKGAGRALPMLCLEENTTWDLVADIEKVRQHIDIPEHQLANEMKELKEIHMEDTEEEEMHDIDSCDFGNSLAVVEYVDEIYSFYRRTEVHYKFELLGEILFLTVNIIDRYLARENVARKKLLLLLLQVYGTCRDKTNSIYFFVLCFD
ncbi:hypothetical protein VPH35_082122 [Triticum aestivum]